MADGSDAREWRAVQAFPEYEVSNDGLVRRVVGQTKGRVLQGEVGPTGYHRVLLWVRDRREKCLVHRLVAEAFHGAPVGERKQVAHADGVPANNRAENLRWVTAKENAADRERHGRTARGVGNAASKLTPERVREIRAAIAAGESHKKIAHRFGVAKFTIFRIRHRQIWRHVL